MEIKLYSIDRDPRFPDGARYSLIFLNKKTGERVLFDNHHPKGHHYHLDEMEYAYDFSDVSTLIEDFKKQFIKDLESNYEKTNHFAGNAL